jgi:hypothetical protein
MPVFVLQKVAALLLGVSHLGFAFAAVAAHNLRHLLFLCLGQHFLLLLFLAALHRHLGFQLQALLLLSDLLLDLAQLLHRSVGLLDLTPAVSAIGLYPSLLHSPRFWPYMGLWKAISDALGL